MPDSYEFSGNFQNAIVTVKSTLTNTTFTINNMPNAGTADKDALKKLIEELTKALDSIPADKREDDTVQEGVEAVATRTDELVKEASAKKVNKKEVEHRGNRLLEAAKNLAAVAPTVLTIATQIVTHIGKLFS